MHKELFCSCHFLVSAHVQVRVLIVSVQRKLKAPLHPICLIFIIGYSVVVFVFFSGCRSSLAIGEKVKGEISPVQFDGPSLYRVLWLFIIVALTSPG